jgi:hypothetical protein
MTTYGVGLEYDDALDILYHAGSNVAGGVYASPSMITVDNQGHITDITAGSAGTHYIQGLGFEYKNTTEITVLPGAAYIPGYNRVVELEAAQTVLRPTTAADAVWYLYMREANGAGYIEADTVAPAAPYYAAAATMFDDVHSRFVGMIRQRGSVIEPFTAEEYGNMVRVIYDAPPALVASTSVVSTVSKDIGHDAATVADRWIPPNVRAALVEAVGAGSTSLSFIGYGNSSATAPRTVRSQVWLEYNIGLGPSQELEYTVLTGGSVAINLVGYNLRR